MEARSRPSPLEGAGCGLRSRWRPGVTPRSPSASERSGSRRARRSRGPRPRRAEPARTRPGTPGAQVMDPIMDPRAPRAHYHAPIWDSLVGFDLEKGGIGPGVAERWELAADGKSWTFYLRKGQRFHNGDPVTAHDVKFSLERVMSPESISSGAAALRRAVDRIEGVDDLTVRGYTKGVIPQVAASLSRAVFIEGSVMSKK